MSQKKYYTFSMQNPSRSTTHSRTEVYIKGTKSGDDALAFYADLFNQGIDENIIDTRDGITASEIFRGTKATCKIVVGAVGGFFSALWTQDTAQKSVMVMQIAVPYSSHLFNSMKTNVQIEYSDPVIKNLSEVKQAATMCKDVYNDTSTKLIGNNCYRMSIDELKLLFKGYKIDLTLLNPFKTNPDSGFAAAFYKTLHNIRDINSVNKYYLCFRGTEMDSFDHAKKDWATNFKQGVGGFNTPQYTMAMRLAQDLASTKRVQFTIIGHSLGGGLTGAAASKTGLRGITFNAAGVNPKILKTLPSKRDIVNYTVLGEILTSVQEYGLIPTALGKTEYLWPAKQESALKLHGMVSVIPALELLS